MRFIWLLLLTGCDFCEPFPRVNGQCDTTKPVAVAEIEGCKLFVVRPLGRDVYFTNCKGSTRYSYLDGKIIREEEVPGR